MKQNIDYWEAILHNPSQAYKLLFKREKAYLKQVVTKNSIVLDIGCGDGRNIESIAKKSHKVVGLDIDKKALMDARKNLKDFSNVKLVRGSAFDLPFKDQSFDFVILSMTLVNFGEHISTALKEMRRVVRDDGKIVISVYSEKAKRERHDMYQAVGVPIEKIEKDRFIFAKSVGAHTSQQFTLSKIKKLAKLAGLRVEEYEEIGMLAYLLTLVKS